MVVTLFSIQSLMINEYARERKNEKIIETSFKIMEFLVSFHKETLKKIKLIRVKLKEKELEKEKMREENK